MDRRVVVTGIGLVTPIGLGLDNNWKAICEGKSGIKKITKFDTSELKTKIGGEIREFNAEDFMSPKDARRSDKFIIYAVSATKLALDDSGVEITDDLSPRAGAFIGTGIGGMETYSRTMIVMLDKGPNRVSPFFIPNILTNMASGFASIYFNAKGPNCCTTTACAASTHAIGYSMWTIRKGDADVMITGGAEAPLIPVSVAGFNSMKALSTKNEPPEAASRPFDIDRDGFVISEGAGILILEELEFAKKRGANIYAEIVGSGMSSDAHHITSPSLDGPIRSMQAALKDSKVDKDLIDYINAHGTSTKQNDLNETNAIKQIFGDRSYKIPVSSTKSMTGHLLGAAGGVEAAITSLSLYNGILTPTINLDNPDPECDLDYVANTSRDGDIKYAMSNSFGFGGTNGALIFKKFN
ncbi:MAG: beta-ketoacyl-ACP synthase II [Thermodesulfobacteriota bacterium]